MAVHDHDHNHNHDEDDDANAPKTKTQRCLPPGSLGATTTTTLAVEQLRASFNQFQRPVPFTCSGSIPRKELPIAISSTLKGQQAYFSPNTEDPLPEDRLMQEICHHAPLTCPTIPLHETRIAEEIEQNLLPGWALRRSSSSKPITQRRLKAKPVNLYVSFQLASCELHLNYSQRISRRCSRIRVSQDSHQGSIFLSLPSPHPLSTKFTAYFHPLYWLGARR